MFQPYDRIKVMGINRSFSKSECSPGTATPKISDVATVLEVYREPVPGYELEACDQIGQTLWLISVAEGDLDLQRVDNIFQDASRETTSPSMPDATVKVSSPDKKHIAELIYSGEIRFGPAYFSLVLDSRKVKRRIFGNKLAWSDDSRYLALQEWLTAKEKKRPSTRVLLIDMHTRKAAELDIIRGGFAEEFVFKNHFLCYKKHDFSQKKIESAEVEISSIKKWRGLGF